MSGINKVILVGHVGRDPEIRTTQEGKELAKFSLATTDSWKDKVTGEKKERTEWHRIVIFNQGLTQIAKNYIRKGSKLYIEGSLQTRKYAGEDNIDRYTTEIVLQGFNSNLTMLDRKEFSNMTIPDTNTIPDVESKGASNSEDTKKLTKIEDLLDDEVPF